MLKAIMVVMALMSVMSTKQAETIEAPRTYSEVIAYKIGEEVHSCTIEVKGDNRITLKERVYIINLFAAINIAHNKNIDCYEYVWTPVIDSIVITRDPETGTSTTIYGNYGDLEDGGFVREGDLFDMRINVIVSMPKST